MDALEIVKIDQPRVRHFTDLLVWQQARQLTKQIYLITRRFPKEEIYGLTNQMRRSVVSVAANIAEGHSRESLREYLHHRDRLASRVAITSAAQRGFGVCKIRGCTANTESLRENLQDA